MASWRYRAQGLIRCVCSAVGLVRDTEMALGADDAHKKVIVQALDHAVSTAVIAEAEIAKALGYQLCKCSFPPAMMLTVGHRGRPDQNS
jgi:hypothetical protein